MTIEEYKEMPEAIVKREIEIINAKIADLDQEKAKAIVALTEKHV